MSTLRQHSSSHAVRFHRPIARSALAAVIVATAACSSGHSNPTGPGTAALSVQITAPVGITPIVIVTGPSGFLDTVHATTKVTGLAAGSYTVLAAPAISTDSIVGNIDTASVSGSPANLAAGDSASVTVTYVARTGSGGLWVANVLSGAAVRYSAGQLRSSTALAPSTTITTGQAAWSVAFDAGGNLWVAQADNNTVAMYASGQLGADGSPPAAVTLSATGGSLSHPGRLAFDHSGNLWVANAGDSSVVEFTTPQLASSGSPAPAVVISASNGSLSIPQGLAFDANGNLWVSNQGDSSVVEFTTQQLGASGSPQPAVVIGSSSGSLIAPYGLAFDRTGNLWVANLLANTVIEFGQAQLAASGTPNPKVILSTSSGSLNGPVGLAFDASGGLWVANEGGSVVKFAGGALGTTGSPTPSVVLTGSGISEPFGLAFDPHAVGLPLQP